MDDTVAGISDRALEVSVLSESEYFDAADKLSNATNNSAAEKAREPDVKVSAATMECSLKEDVEIEIPHDANHLCQDHNIAYSNPAYDDSDVSRTDTSMHLRMQSGPSCSSTPRLTPARRGPSPDSTIVSVEAPPGARDGADTEEIPETLAPRGWEDSTAVELGNGTAGAVPVNDVLPAKSSAPQNDLVYLQESIESDSDSSTSRSFFFY